MQNLSVEKYIIVGNIISEYDKKIEQKNVEIENLNNTVAELKKQIEDIEKQDIQDSNQEQ